MSLIVPSQYAIQKPPAGAQVNPDHPLAAGLVMAVLFNEGGPAANANIPSVPRDLFGYKLVPTAGVSAYPSWITGRSGPAIRFTPNGGLLANTTFPASAVAKACTIITIAKPRNSGDQASLFGNHTGTSDRIQAHFPFSSTFYFDYGNGFVNNISRVSFTPAASFFNVWHHMVYHGGGSIPIAIWADGRLQVQGTSATTVALSGNGMDLGSFAGSANTADMELFLVYNRVLTPQEIAWSNAQPYAFLTPTATPLKRFFLMGLNQVPVNVARAIPLESGSAQLIQTASIKLESRIQVTNPRAIGVEAKIAVSQTAGMRIEAQLRAAQPGVLDVEARGLLSQTAGARLEAQRQTSQAAAIPLEDRTGSNKAVLLIEARGAIAQAAGLRLEAKAKLTALGAVSVETGPTAATVTAAIKLEARGMVVQTAVARVESQSRSRQSQIANLEAGALNLREPRILALESIIRPALMAAVKLEAKEQVTLTRALPLEATGNRVKQIATLRMEAQLRRSVPATAKLEARGPVSDALIIPLESTGNHVAQTASFPLEIVTGYYPRQLKLEALNRVVATAGMRLEMRGPEVNVSQTGLIHLETYYGIHSYTPTPRWPFETLLPLTATQAIVFESLGVHVAKTATAVLEGLNAPPVRAAVPVEIRPHDVLPAPTAQVRLEITHWIGVHRPLLIEAERKSPVLAPIAVELRGVVSTARGMAIESIARTSRPMALLVEIAAIKAHVAVTLNLEARGAAPSRLATIPIEAREPSGLLAASAQGTLIIEREGVGTLIVHEALPLSES